MDATIKDIGVLLTFIAGLIAAVGVIYGWIKRRLDKLFAAQLSAIEARLDQMDERLGEVDMESCKNYLVTFLADAERGKPIDEIELERFFEQYGHYTKCGGNSYIKQKVDKLRSAGKI